MKLSFNLQTKLYEDKIKGLDETKLKTALFDLMIAMMGHAKRFSPVDTGRLKASIHIFPTSPAKKITMADGVKYGIFQEFGTFKMKAQPFFRPAMRLALAKDLKQICEKLK